MLAAITGEFRLSAFFKAFFSLSINYISDCRVTLTMITKFQGVESGWACLKVMIWVKFVTFESKSWFLDSWGGTLKEEQAGMLKEEM